jgi:hypothetical protein
MTTATPADTGVVYVTDVKAGGGKVAGWPSRRPEGPHEPRLPAPATVDGRPFRLAPQAANEAIMAAEGAKAFIIRKRISRYCLLLSLSGFIGCAVAA